MRGTRIAMTVGGLLLLLIGVAATVWTVTNTGSAAALGIGIVGGTFLVTGVAFLLAGRYMGGLDTTALLRDGIPGTGEVLFTQDSGTVINNVNLVVNLGLRVTVPGTPPYDVTIKHVQRGRQQWSAIQPGMVVPVRVDPRDPRKVAIGGGSAFDHGVKAPAGHPTMVKLRAADVVAQGVATHGQILSAQPSGMTAGQVEPGLPPHEAGDPLFHTAFAYTGPDGTTRHKEALIRVPHGKIHLLAPGSTVPVAYLPADPGVATVDWFRT